MKLAEALLTRKDLQTRRSMLTTRLAVNARAQEGERPAEDPTALLAELDAVTDELTSLCARINLTNSQSLDRGESLTTLLSRRDADAERVRMLRDFLNVASDLGSRVTRAEIKLISTVDVAALRKRVDQLSKELRELDMRIQSLNWTLDLL